MIKKFLLLSSVILLSFSFSFGAINQMEINSKFDKEPQLIKTNKNFKKFDTKIKTYSYSNNKENDELDKSYDKRNYQRIKHDYFKETSNKVKNGDFKDTSNIYNYRKKENIGFYSRYSYNYDITHRFTQAYFNTQNLRFRSSDSYNQKLNHLN